MTTESRGIHKRRSASETGKNGKKQVDGSNREMLGEKMKKSRLGCAPRTWMRKQKSWATAEKEGGGLGVKERGEFGFRKTEFFGGPSQK